MSAITLSAPSSQILTPFCDKKFQTLRFIASTISDICKSFFLKIVALFIQICSKRQSDSLNSYADYLQIKSASHLDAFLTYGSQIVDFAINSTKVPKTPKSNEIEALKERYGERVLQKWSTIGTAELPLRRTELSRLDMSKGCCFGMSLDFICRYLKALQQGQTPRDAIKAIAPLYAEGATPHAEVMQIFYQALDCSSHVEAAFEGVKTWVNDEKKRFINIANGNGQYTEKELINLHKAFKLEFDKKMQEIKKNRVLRDRSIFSQLDTIFSQKLGLNPQLNAIYTVEPTEGSQMGNNYQQFIHQLPQGVYKVDLSRDKGGHSMVFIKTANEHFLFDPNIGTLALPREKAIPELWRLGSMRYHSMYFTSMALAVQ